MLPALASETNLTFGSQFPHFSPSPHTAAVIVSMDPPCKYSPDLIHSVSPPSPKWRFPLACEDETFRGGKRCATPRAEESRRLSLTESVGSTCPVELRQKSKPNNSKLTSHDGQSWNAAVVLPT